MDLSSEDFFCTKLFDHRIYALLNCVVQNVTNVLRKFNTSGVDLFNHSHGNHSENSLPTNISSPDGLSQERMLESDRLWFTTQLIAVIWTLWLIDRHFLKTTLIQTFVEGVIVWWLIFIALPVLIPVGGAVLLYRFGLILKFKIFNGGQYKLMDPFDAVWTFENPFSTSTCNGLYVIKGVGDLDKIRDLLRKRVLEKKCSQGNFIYARFRWSLCRKHGYMCWNTDTSTFDVTEHIRYCLSADKGPESEWTEEDVFKVAASLQDVSLDRPGKSPWEILVMPNFRLKNVQERHYAILFRVHHSLGDGISMGHILYQGIADEPYTFSVDPCRPLKISRIRIWTTYFVSFLLFPQTTLRNAFFQEQNAFHSPQKMLTGPKTVTWSRPISLAAVKELKNKTDSSVFTVLLSCLTGAMARLYIKHGENVPAVIYAAPPLAILPYPDRNPRNRFSVVLYPLALATEKDNAVERLHAVFRTSKKIASSPDILSNFFVIYLMGLLPFEVMKIFAGIAHSTMTFSNMPGPVNKVKVFNGDELVETGAWIPVKNSIGIAMGVFSYNDKLRVTFIADKACLPNSDDVDLLREYFETELVRLAQMLEINSNNIPLFIQN